MEIYKSILDIFSKATGMQISATKYSFLHYGVAGVVRDHIQNLFPYDFKPLDEGFK